jgi:pentatricopeptide repeat protein
MSALEKGLQWERALDLFDEMKLKGLPITVVSYGCAIAACEKGKEEVMDMSKDWSLVLSSY